MRSASICEKSLVVRFPPPEFFLRRVPCQPTIFARAGVPAAPLLPECAQLGLRTAVTHGGGALQPAYRLGRIARDGGALEIGDAQEVAHFPAPVTDALGGGLAGALDHRR